MKRQTVKQKMQGDAERSRYATLREEENRLSYERFVGVMAEKFQIKVLPFSGQKNQNLPAYVISKLDGRVIAFADILFEPLDEYIKIPMGRFKNGAFITEIFGVIKDKELRDCSSMRYVIFLLNKEDIYQFSYKKRAKPFPTLPDGESEIVVVLNRRDFTPI